MSVSRLYRKVPPFCAGPLDASGPLDPDDPAVAVAASRLAPITSMAMESISRFCMLLLSELPASDHC